MTYFYNDELHLIEEAYQKLANCISKRLKEITNSNPHQSIAPKKTPNKFVDTDFLCFKSVTKALTRHHRRSSRHQHLTTNAPY